MIEAAVREGVKQALQERQTLDKTAQGNPITDSKPKLETSKKLLYFVTALYAVSWAVVVVSLLLHGETPWELIRYTTLLFTAECVVYGCKGAYEDKERGRCE